MLILTIDLLEGKTYEPLGVVMGSSIQTVHAGKDIAASFKTLIGGELTSYNKMMADARETAIQRMTAEAESKHADAIIGVRFSSSSVMQSAAEVLVYGTAIKYQ